MENDNLLLKLLTENGLFETAETLKKELNAKNKTETENNNNNIINLEQETLNYNLQHKNNENENNLFLEISNYLFDWIINFDNIENNENAFQSLLSKIIINKNNNISEEIILQFWKIHLLQLYLTEEIIKTELNGENNENLVKLALKLKNEMEIFIEMISDFSNRNEKKIQFWREKCIFLVRVALFYSNYISVIPKNNNNSNEKSESEMFENSLNQIKNCFTNEFPKKEETTKKEKLYVLFILLRYFIVYELFNNNNHKNENIQNFNLFFHFHLIEKIKNDETIQFIKKHNNAIIKKFETIVEKHLSELLFFHSKNNENLLEKNHENNNIFNSITEQFPIKSDFKPQKKNVNTILYSSFEKESLLLHFFNESYNHKNELLDLQIWNKQSENFKNKNENNFMEALKNIENSNNNNNENENEESFDSEMSSDDILLFREKDILKEEIVIIQTSKNNININENNNNNNFLIAMLTCRGRLIVYNIYNINNNNNNENNNLEEELIINCFLPPFIKNNNNNNNNNNLFWYEQYYPSLEFSPISFYENENKNKIYKNQFLLVSNCFSKESENNNNNDNVFLYSLHKENNNNNNFKNIKNISEFGSHRLYKSFFISPYSETIKIETQQKRKLNRFIIISSKFIDMRNYYSDYNYNEKDTQLHYFENQIRLYDCLNENNNNFENNNFENLENNNNNNWRMAAAFYLSPFQILSLTENNTFIRWIPNNNKNNNNNYYNYEITQQIFLNRPVENFLISNSNKMIYIISHDSPLMALHLFAYEERIKKNENKNNFENEENNNHNFDRDYILPLSDTQYNKIYNNNINDEMAESENFKKRKINYKNADAHKKIILIGKNGFPILTSNLKSMAEILKDGNDVIKHVLQNKLKKEQKMIPEETFPIHFFSGNTKIRFFDETNQNNINSLKDIIATSFDNNDDFFYSAETGKKVRNFMIQHILNKNNNNNNNETREIRYDKNTLFSLSQNENEKNKNGNKERIIYYPSGSLLLFQETEEKLCEAAKIPFESQNLFYESNNANFYKNNNNNAKNNLHEELNHEKYSFLNITISKNENNHNNFFNFISCKKDWLITFEAEKEVEEKINSVSYYGEEINNNNNNSENENNERYLCLLASVGPFRSHLQNNNNQNIKNKRSPLLFFPGAYFFLMFDIKLSNVINVIPFAPTDPKISIYKNEIINNNENNNYGNEKLLFFEKVQKNNLIASHDYAEKNPIFSLQCSLTNISKNNYENNNNNLLLLTIGGLHHIIYFYNALSGELILKKQLKSEFEKNENEIIKNENNKNNNLSLELFSRLRTFTDNFWFNNENENLFLFSNLLQNYDPNTILQSYYYYFHPFVDETENIFSENNNNNNNPFSLFSENTENNNNNKNNSFLLFSPKKNEMEKFIFQSIQNFDLEMKKKEENSVYHSQNQFLCGVIAAVKTFYIYENNKNNNEKDKIHFYCFVSSESGKLLLLNDFIE